MYMAQCVCLEVFLPLLSISESVCRMYDHRYKNMFQYLWYEVSSIVE